MLSISNYVSVAKKKKKEFGMSCNRFIDLTSISFYYDVSLIRK